MYALDTTIYKYIGSQVYFVELAILVQSGTEIVFSIYIFQN